MPAQDTQEAIGRGEGLGTHKAMGFKGPEAGGTLEGEKGKYVLPQCPLCARAKSKGLNFPGHEAPC